MSLRATSGPFPSKWLPPYENGLFQQSCISFSFLSCTSLPALSDPSSQAVALMKRWVATSAPVRNNLAFLCIKGGKDDNFKWVFISQSSIKPSGSRSVLEQSLGIGCNVVWGGCCEGESHLIPWKCRKCYFGPTGQTNTGPM